MHGEWRLETTVVTVYSLHLQFVANWASAFIWILFGPRSVETRVVCRIVWVFSPSYSIEVGALLGRHTTTTY
eukprot:7381869-Prymnesium_polylepis.3